MEKKKEDGIGVTLTTTLRGIITVWDWDEDGNVISLCLSTFDDKEYLVDNRSVSFNLLKDLIREKIEVSGTIKDGGMGRKVIEIEDFRVLGENSM